MPLARIRIKGRVQGVGFRYHTRAQADAMGVNGWVRNLSDGSVEAELEGTDEAVDAMIEWCRRGPATARVDAVEVEWREATAKPAHAGFTLRA